MIGLKNMFKDMNSTNSSNNTLEINTEMIQEINFYIDSNFFLIKFFRIKFHI